MSRPMDEYKITEMSVEAWIGVPDNPRQRNTELHARKAIEWLREPSVEHAVVHAARRRDNGNVMKLDGHTRAFLWERNEIPRPDKVHCIIYAVDDLAGLCELYSHFDNIRAAETASDQTYGAMQQMGFHPQSNLLKGCKFITAVKYATMYELGFASTGKGAISMSPYSVIPHWRKELRTLDGLDMSRGRFPGPLMTASLMSMRRLGAAAENFWVAFRDEEAQRAGRTRNAVAALLEILQDKRMRNTGNSTVFHKLTGQALSCVDAYISGQSYTGTPRVTKPESYLALSRAQAKFKPRIAA